MTQNSPPLMDLTSTHNASVTYPVDLAVAPEVACTNVAKNSVGTADKFRYLDSLRGVAALIVVQQHFAAAYFPQAVFGGDIKAHGAWEKLFHFPPLSIFCSAHTAVCLFFILSGYVLSYKFIGRKCRTQVFAAGLKRPLRLWGVVGITIALSYSLSCMGVYYNQEASLLSNSSWLARWWTSTPGWQTFLLDMSWFSFAHGPNYATQLWTIELELYGALLVYGYLLVGPHPVARLLCWGVMGALFAKTYYIGFLLGIGCAEGKKLLDAKQWKIPASVAWSLLLIGLVLASKPNYLDREALLETPYAFLVRYPQIPRTGFDMLAAICLFSGVLFLKPVQRFLEIRVLSYIGTISYSLYAVHFMIMGSLSCALYLLMYETLGHTGSVILSFAVSMVAIVGTAHLVHNYVDHLFIQLSGKLGRWIESWSWLKALLGEAKPAASISASIPALIDEPQTRKQVA
jgi:peptidoglycan/LPS O-acetylase OafA/YrhL